MLKEREKEEDRKGAVGCDREWYNEEGWCKWRKYEDRVEIGSWEIGWPTTNG